MGPERRNMPEQERSIRDREQELFVEPQESTAAPPPVKPFPIYLRETPAKPLAPQVKAILWVIGIGVLLLLCVALWRSQQPSRLRTPARRKTSALPNNQSSRHQRQVSVQSAG